MVGPAGGEAPGKVLRPPRINDYMTRRAFLALRVIQRQGKFRSKRDVKKTGERYDSRTVFRRFLVIHEFVLHGGAI